MPSLLEPPIDISTFVGGFDPTAQEDYGGYNRQYTGLRIISFRTQSNTASHAQHFCDCVGIPYDETKALELTVISYDDNGIQQDRIEGKIQYLNAHPHCSWFKSIENVLIEFHEFEDYHYATITKSPLAPFQKRNDIIIQPEREYLLPGMSLSSFPSTVVKKREYMILRAQLSVLYRTLMNSVASEDVYTAAQAYLNHSKKMYDTIRSHFGSGELETLDNIEPVKKSKVHPKHKKLPLFTLAKFARKSFSQ